MARIFISYSSKDRDKVGPLADDLKELGHDVWYDRELGGTGGQKWWTNILEQIRDCQVVIFVLTPASLNSDPCRREYAYAHALLKPILPVTFEAVDIPSLPRELQEIQFVDYREQSRKQAINLASSLTRLPPPRPMPDPLPPEPETPPAPTARISDRLDQPSLSASEQMELLFELEMLLKDPMTQVSANNLLDRLKKRADLSAKVAEKIRVLTVKPAQPHRMSFMANTRRFQLTCSVIVATLVVGIVGMYVYRNGLVGSTTTPTPTQLSSTMLASDTPRTTTSTPATAVPVTPDTRELVEKNADAINKFDQVFNDFTPSTTPLTISNISSLDSIAESNDNPSISALAWSGDGKVIAVSGLNYVWLLHGDDLTSDPYGYVGLKRPIKSLSFSRDNVMLAIGTDEEPIVLWNVQTNTAHHIGTDTSIHHAAFTDAIDKFLVVSSTTAAASRKVELWSVNGTKPDELVWELAGDVTSATVRQLAISPNGKYAALASDVGTLYWVVGSADAPITLPGLSDDVRAVAISPNSDLLAVGYGTGLIELWALPNLQRFERKLTTTTRAAITALTFNRDGALLAGADVDGDTATLNVWDITQNKPLVTKTARGTQITGIAFNNNNTMILTGGFNGHLRLWGIP